MSSSGRDPSEQTRRSVAAAIAKHFDGNSVLYDTFAASCALQFAADAVNGQTACDSGDLPRLRRLTHDLASVLQVLGHQDLSELATRSERHALDVNLAAASESWQALHDGLLRLCPPSTGRKGPLAAK